VQRTGQEDPTRESGRGGSAGTWLGAHYATAFPDRVDKVGYRFIYRPCVYWQRPDVALPRSPAAVCRRC
jgi:pimeloyl-ACP methyl ester carboxylesterase